MTISPANLQADTCPFSNQLGHVVPAATSERAGQSSLRVFPRRECCPCAFARTGSFQRRGLEPLAGV